MLCQFPSLRFTRDCQAGAIVCIALAMIGCNDYAEQEKDCNVAWKYESEKPLALSSGGAFNRPGWFVLFRQASHLCAVRIMNIMTTADPESGCASYEAYSWVDGHADRIEGRSGALSHFGDKGPHGFSVPQGRSSIDCGAVDIRWVFPTALAPAYEFQPSTPIEYALTAWERIETVDPLDSRLVWMPYDVDGRSLREFLPDELPR